MAKIIDCVNIIVPGCFIYDNGDIMDGYVWTSDDCGKVEWKPAPIGEIGDTVDTLIVKGCLILPNGSGAGLILTSDGTGKGIWSPVPPPMIDNQDKKYSYIYEDDLAVGDLVKLSKTYSASVEKIKCEEWSWQISCTFDIDSSLRKIQNIGISINCQGKLYVVGTSSETSTFYDNEGNLVLFGPIINQTLLRMYVNCLTSCGVWEWTATCISFKENPFLPDTYQLNSSLIVGTTVTDRCDNVYVIANVGAIPHYYNAGIISSDMNDASLVGRRGNLTDIGGGVMSANSFQVSVAMINKDGEWVWQASLEDAQQDNQIRVNNFVTVNCYSDYVYIVVDNMEKPLFYNSGITESTEMDATIEGVQSVRNQISIAKLDRFGKYIWYAFVDNFVRDDHSVCGFVSDNKGDVYVIMKNTYLTFWIPTFYDSSGISQFTAPEDHNLIIAKIDKNGIWQWYATIDSSNSADTIDSIAVKDGDIFISGTINDDVAVYYDAFNSPSNLIGWSGNVGRTSNHIYITKMSFDGKFVWEAVIESSIGSYDQSKIYLDKCGNIYVTSSLYETSSVNNGIPTYYNSDGSVAFVGNSHENNQTIIAKLDRNGNFIWHTSIYNSERSDIVVDDDGNIYVNGTSSFNNLSPVFYDINDNINVAIDGVMGFNALQYLGKMANDTKSSIIGLVENIDMEECSPTMDCLACVSFCGETKVDNIVETGKDYYVQTTNPCILTTERTNICGCPNRFIGKACDETTIIMNTYNIND